MTTNRYQFGKNWWHFIGQLDEEQVADAQESLIQFFGCTSLEGKRFLDVGSGSGLFSLAARRLGAYVQSFDYDPLSVAATMELRRRFFPDDLHWKVERGSVLDRRYLELIGRFDLVYAWGVLHHTGDMWDAMDAVVTALMKPGGLLYLSLYNDQGWVSAYWETVKAAYNRYHWLRPALSAFHAPYLLVGRWFAWAINGTRRKHRGMTIRTDFFDWLGGYLSRWQRWMLCSTSTGSGRWYCNECSLVVGGTDATSFSSPRSSELGSTSRAVASASRISAPLLPGSYIAKQRFYDCRVAVKPPEINQLVFRFAKHPCAGECQCGKKVRLPLFG